MMPTLTVSGHDLSVLGTYHVCLPIPCPTGDPFGMFPHDRHLLAGITVVDKEVTLGPSHRQLRASARPSDKARVLPSRVQAD